MSSALLTDLYQLTMAQGYREMGMDDTHACFNLFFRDHPFGGGFTVAAGTGLIHELVESMRFTDEDIAYLEGLEAPLGGRMFRDDFLAHLRDLEPELDVDAVPEGTLVHPRVPMVRVRGPIMACQLLETMLLNLVNFQTLIATKAARVCMSARGGAVAEFGLRRAQGPDGGTSASRASYVGGCASTSNVVAGQRYGIPVSGTHAHSWVQAFPSELEAFRAYARTQPKNCILLVDTYDVEQGVANAITVAHEMEERGEKLSGIRIDSGDLAELSKLARSMFDEAGLPYVRISVSNDLDEYLVSSLLSQGAPIDAWGVGTKLATSYEQPALGGVYKLSAVRSADGAWEPKLKVSESVFKLTIPGVLDARRYEDPYGRPVADMIVDPTVERKDRSIIVDPLDEMLTFDVTGLNYHDLLAPVVRGGEPVGEPESLEIARERCLSQIERLPSSMKRFMNPQTYPAGLELGLHEARAQMIRTSGEVRSRVLWAHDGGERD